MQLNIPLPERLRAEEEIISTWKVNISKPLVSVRCITYNHGPYIEDAIKGFLIQKTDFPIEVWIHDDASTDGTREIIEKYQQLYPRIIKTILQDENQYSRGVKPSQFLDAVCTGEYYAICEGDDYWVTPEKLSKQVSVMECNPNVDMCFHLAYKINMETGIKQIIGWYRETEGLVPAEYIIERTFGQIPTASTFVRSTVYKDVADFRDKAKDLIVGDIYLHILGSTSRGAAYFIDSPMSCYRHLVPGSYSVRIRGVSGKQVLEKGKISVNAYACANEMTDKKFEKSFNRKIARTVKKAVKADVSVIARMIFLFSNFKFLGPKDFSTCFVFVLIPRRVIEGVRRHKNNRLGDRVRY